MTFITPDEWNILGTTLSVAHAIATETPETLVAMIKTERGRVGTVRERALLTALDALREAADSQARIADQAIKRLRICAKMVNDEALAQLDGHS
jgi:hypothetical protein